MLAELGVVEFRHIAVDDDALEPRAQRGEPVRLRGRAGAAEMEIAEDDRRWLGGTHDGLDFVAFGRNALGQDLRPSASYRLVRGLA